MKRKVYVALVGGQMMPVFIGIRKTRPDEVVLIHSDASLKEAVTIKNAFDGKVELRRWPPVDYAAIQKKTEVLLSEFEDCDLIINVTSGTKPWTLAFALLSQARPQVMLLYIDQNGVTYDCTHHARWEPETTLDMDTLMCYNGQHPRRYTLLADYTPEDLQTLAAVKKLRLRNIKDFNALSIPSKEWKRRLEGSNEGKHELESGSSITWNRTQKTVCMSLINKNGVWKERFTSPHVFQLVFYAGWFEYEMAVLLSRWSRAKEIWLNVVYPYHNNLPKNEIDIVVNTGSKLLMVECKTQISDNTDIDKFHTAVKNYGGMGCKALFVTEAKMKAQALEKCSDSGILTFDLAKYANLRLASKDLFIMLDRELFYINTK